MKESHELDALVQTQHLEGDALQGYRETFMSHPACVVTLKSFLHPHVAERVACFLTKETVYRKIFGLYSADNSKHDITEEEWLRAEEKDRFYRYSVAHWEKISPEFPLSPNLLTWRRFRSAVVQSGFKRFLEAISGLLLGGNTEVVVHATKRGDFLRPHNDRNSKRRLAFILYLSADWSPRFGGALCVLDHDGNVTQIEAEYNSFVVFDVTTHKEHFIAPVSSAAGERSRLSIGGWLKNPD